jgi:two-component system response regulator YesN
MNERNITLLIVDDELEIREGMNRSVPWAENGITVIGTAANGREALRLIETMNPDIVLLDIIMPLMNGLEVLDHLPGIKRTPEIIILSGHDDFKYCQHALRHGAADYLLKPCHPQEILAVINNLKRQILAFEAQSGQPQHLVAQSSQNINQIREQQPLHKHSWKVVKHAVEYMENHFTENLNLEKVAQTVFVSPGYLSTLFKQELQRNFVDYLHEIRIRKAKELLANIHLKIYEVAIRVGYKDAKYFSQVFKKLTGLAPNQYRDTIPH